MHRFILTTLLLLFPSAALAVDTIIAVITASRTSGVAPLAVHFDGFTATSTTKTPTPLTESERFHELDYTWGFDDTGAGSWSYNSENQDKNSAKGPNTAHVFESAGSYDVTLTVRAGNGVSDDATAVTITVSDPDDTGVGTFGDASETICIRDDNVPDNWDGCPTASPVQATIGVTSGCDDLDDCFTTYMAAERRFLLRRGDIFAANASMVVGNDGPGIVGTWGTGDKPIVNVTGADAFKLGDGCPEGTCTVGMTDWRFVDLDMRSVSGGQEIFVNNARDGENVKQLTILRITDGSGDWAKVVELGPWPSGLHANEPAVHEEIAIVETESTDSREYFLFIGATKPMILGNRIACDGYYEAAPDEKKCHGARIQYSQRAVFQHNYAHGPVGLDNGSQLFRFSGWGSSSWTLLNNVDVYYGVISDNLIVGGSGAHGTGIGAAYNVNEGEVYDFIVERNHFIAEESGKSHADRLIKTSAERVTIRNNVVDAGVAAEADTMFVHAWKNPCCAQIAYDVRIYNNSIYDTDDNSQGKVLRCTEYSGTTHHTVQNNVVHTPNDATINMVNDTGDCLGEVDETTNIGYNSAASSPFSTDPPTTILHFRPNSDEDDGTADDLVQYDFDLSLRAATPDAGAFEYQEAAGPTSAGGVSAGGVF
jgi:PKD repeat protein